MTAKGRYQRSLWKTYLCSMCDRIVSALVSTELMGPHRICYTCYTQV